MLGEYLAAPAAAAAAAGGLPRAVRLDALGGWGVVRGRRGDVLIVYVVTRHEIHELRGVRRVFPGELSHAERVDALLLGSQQVSPVVGQEHDALAGYGSLVKLGGDAYRPVVTVVRGLPGLGLDVRVPVVLVGEHEEALRRVLAHRAKPVVARLAPVPALLQHHGQHHDVGDGLVR